MAAQLVTTLKVNAEAVGEILESLVEFQAGEDGETIGDFLRGMIEDMVSMSIVEDSILYCQQHVDKLSKAGVLERNLKDIECEQFGDDEIELHVISLEHPKVLKGQFREIERGGDLPADRWLGSSLIEAFRWSKKDSHGGALLVFVETIEPEMMDDEIEGDEEMEE